MQLSDGCHSPKKILFISAAADGHFYPLTGLAKHLQSLGHDVRWFTQSFYQEKLTKLGIPHYPYVYAPQINQENFPTFFAEREQQKSQLAKFKFDLEYVFINPLHEGVKDLENIYNEFAFDIVVADIFSFIIPIVKARFKVPVIAVGVIPLMHSSRHLPPAGLGMLPASSFLGRLKHSMMRWMTDKIMFAKLNKLYRDVIAVYGAHYPGKNMFDILYDSADIVLQSCTPAFEYKSSDLPSNIRFAGPMLPYTVNKGWTPWYDDRLTAFDTVIIVTQGTVEKDVNKLLVPALEAFKDSDVLVICTTGGSQTRELRQQFIAQNIIIEDFIPFADIMPYADAYITNGGYGGVMLGIQNELPLVVAGVHEGKVEICARVGYFNYGINLKTETPKPHQIRKAITEVLSNPVYKMNVQRLRAEFGHYNANELCAQYVSHLCEKPVRELQRSKVPGKI